MRFEADSEKNLQEYQNLVQQRIEELRNDMA